MARSGPKGETELESIFDGVEFAGLALASQNHDRVSGRGTEGAAGSEFWVEPRITLPATPVLYTTGSTSPLRSESHRRGW